MVENVVGLINVVVLMDLEVIIVRLGDVYHIEVLVQELVSMVLVIVTILVSVILAGMEDYAIIVSNFLCNCNFLRITIT